MSSESGREMSVLKIHKPDDTDTFVKLRVIDKISFVDPSDSYQESVYTFNNTPSASREVHVEDIDGLKVERLNSFKMNDYGQEHIFSLFADPSAHKSTHETKIYRYDNGEKDEDTWVKVRRVDELRVVDPSDSYQETIYKLDWPDQSIEDWDANAGGGELCKFPIRIDPFQSIIDAQFSSYCMMVTICNVNSITDDNFNFRINGKLVFGLNFAPDNEKTTYIIEVGNIRKFMSPWPDMVISETKKYESIQKSPFILGVNNVNFENTADNGHDNYFEMTTSVFSQSGKQVMTETKPINILGGESHSDTIDLSSLKAKK